MCNSTKACLNTDKNVCQNELRDYIVHRFATSLRGIGCEKIDKKALRVLWKVSLKLFQWMSHKSWA